MSRTTVILVSVLAVVAIGGGAYLWMNRTNLSLPGLKTNTNAVSSNLNASNTNTTQVNANLSTPDTLKGDQALDQTLTIGGASVHFTSSLKDDTYESVAAPKDSEFVVVYFDGLPTDNISSVNQALKSDVHLLVGTTVVPLTALKVAGTLVKNDRGYLKFVVATGAKNMTLEIGSGASSQKIKLAY